MEMLLIGVNESMNTYVYQQLSIFVNHQWYDESPLQSRVGKSSPL